MGKLDDPVRWHLNHATLNIFVSKEDEKSQIFLKLTVLLCNIARNWYLLNWYVSNIFKIKSFVFTWEGLKGALQCNFFGRNRCDGRKENMFFYWWLPSASIGIKWY